MTPSLIRVASLPGTLHIENNRAPSGAGVLIVNSSDRIIFRDCTIRNNVAESSGGGINAHNTVFTLENCVISGNRAGNKGGGVKISNSNEGCLISMSTIANNQSALGAGLHLTNSPDLEVEASIFAFNSGGPYLTDLLGSGMRMSCSDIYGNGENGYRPEVFVDEGGIFEADPLFTGPGEYDLLADSPCLPDQHPGGDDCGRIGATVISGTGIAASQSTAAR